jgi:hypothetical protein
LGSKAERKGIFVHIENACFVVEFSDFDEREIFGVFVQIGRRVIDGRSEIANREFLPRRDEGIAVSTGLGVIDREQKFDHLEFPFK